MCTCATTPSSRIATNYLLCSLSIYTTARNGQSTLSLTVDDHGEMRVDAQNWAAAAIESKSDEKEISRAIKVRKHAGIMYMRV